MIELEIDGRKFTAEAGKTIIQVADAAMGFYIPRFCYHPELTIAANCRMCLVEVEKSPKTLPACATPIAQGMKVFTRSPKAIEAQRAVMEYLLINHPLDCPICDQGGECELQDLAVGYGQNASRYDQGKRSVHDKNLGPLVMSFMTRCIQCTRCVRFGDEISGMRELGAYNRGEVLEIGTYVEKAMKSELSGNVIDVCPVGALTSKPYRFRARAWEMVQHPSIAPHDCVGSNIYVHTRGEEYVPQREVMRVVPRANEIVNKVWLSDRDRFSYEGLKNKARIFKPLQKKDGQWHEVDWTSVLNEITAQIKKLIKKQGAKQIGALASPSSTLEEFYLLQKLMRGLGSDNIDHRIRQNDFTDQENFALFPGLNLSLTDIENLDTILLIGSYVRHEQPLLCSRIRKAQLKGAKVFCINPVDYIFNFALQNKMIVNTADIPMSIAQIAKAVCDLQNLETENLFSDIEVNKTAENIAKHLAHGKKIGILLGPHAINHPQTAVIRTLANYLSQKLSATLGFMTDGANTAGGWIAGAVPHRSAAGERISQVGLNAAGMFENELRSYLLLNIEPELDCSNPAMALNALNNAELVICINTFRSKTMDEYAHFILPAAPFTETEGTYVNAEGLWQHFEATGPCFGESKPAWKIFRVLGNLFSLSGFDYQTAHAINKELRAAVDNFTPPPVSRKLPRSLKSQQGIFRIMDWPMYAIDGVVRRSEPLQKTNHYDNPAVIRINSTLAKNLGLKNGDDITAVQRHSEITLPLLIDDTIADNCVWIAGGIPETAGFGRAYGEVVLKRK